MRMELFSLITIAPSSLFSCFIHSTASCPLCTDSSERHQLSNRIPWNRTLCLFSLLLFFSLLLSSLFSSLFLSLFFLLAQYQGNSRFLRLSPEVSRSEVKGSVAVAFEMWPQTRQLWEEIWTKEKKSREYLRKGRQPELLFFFSTFLFFASSVFSSSLLLFFSSSALLHLLFSCSFLPVILIVIDTCSKTRIQCNRRRHLSISFYSLNCLCVLIPVMIRMRWQKIRERGSVFLLSLVFLIFSTVREQLLLQKWATEKAKSGNCLHLSELCWLRRVLRLRNTRS